MKWDEKIQSIEFFANHGCSCFSVHSFPDENHRSPEFLTSRPGFIEVYSGLLLFAFQFVSTKSEAAFQGRIRILREKSDGNAALAPSDVQGREKLANRTQVLDCWVFLGICWLDPTFFAGWSTMHQSDEVLCLLNKYIAFSLGRNEALDFREYFFAFEIHGRGRGTGDLFLLFCNSKK